MRNKEYNVTNLYSFIPHVAANVAKETDDCQQCKCQQSKNTQCTHTQYNEKH